MPKFSGTCVRWCRGGTAECHRLGGPPIDRTIQPELRRLRKQLTFRRDIVILAESSWRIRNDNRFQVAIGGGDRAIAYFFGEL